MQKAQSIKQNHQSDALPNFRNIGVALRALLLANAMALLLAMVRASSWLDVAQQYLHGAALLQPILLSNLLLLSALSPWLGRLSYRQWFVAVMLQVMLLTFLIVFASGDLYVLPYEHGTFSALRYVLVSCASAALFLEYLRLRAQALSPAVYGARLQALQARIRPHFLFNCINSVLGVVRADPKRAETALEDMAELFRMAMAHDQQLVALQREIELSRRYLELEKLRLGERLQVNWHTEDMPKNAMVPPLMLQPLLENAVYHGIEPLAAGGVIDIRISLRGDEMHLEIYNPRREPRAHYAGNKLALSNIRERLALLFDIEARYTVESGEDFYRVQIVLPYVREQS